VGTCHSHEKQVEIIKIAYPMSRINLKVKEIARKMCIPTGRIITISPSMVKMKIKMSLQIAAVKSMIFCIFYMSLLSLIVISAFLLVEIPGAFFSVKYSML
jgi:hypothetical protein